MMTFVNMRNEGLVIQPTHRLLVNMADFDVSALLAELEDEFEITEFKFDNNDEKQGGKFGDVCDDAAGAERTEYFWSLRRNGQAFYARSN